MSTENIADRFHSETAEGVDAVLERMVEAVGNPLGVSYAVALDVSPNTIKTWRRRGEVPMRFLTEFAQQHGESIDYLKGGRRLVVLGPGEKESAAKALVAKDSRQASYGRPKPDWIQVMIWVVDGLREKGRSPTGDQLVKVVDGIMAVLQVEEETSREAIRSKISALL